MNPTMQAVEAPTEKMIRVPFEVGVTYVNKTWDSLRHKNGSGEKYYVIGIFRRCGKGHIRIQILPDNSPESIQDAVIKNIAQGAMLYAENGTLPESLRHQYEIYEFEQVAGDIHTNNLKCIWRSLKRVIKDTHVQVSKKYLQSYCNEVTWRRNNIHLSPMEKFSLLLSNCNVKGKQASHKNIIK